MITLKVEKSRKKCIYIRRKIKMSIKLKNNQETEDPKLDRLVQFDERSRAYSIADVLTSKKLRSYTWRCNDWFDQGREGACVGFALGHELAARPAEVKGLDYDYLVKEIYWEAQKIDPWEGGSYPGASPEYAGTSILAGVKRVKQLGWIEEYRWAFNIEDVLYGIGHNGPAVLGIPWHYDMYFPDDDGFIKPTGQIVGGHAILARAINMKKGYVTLRNSWGKSWGKKGDCYISFEDLEKLLNNYGECCFLIKRKSEADPEEEVEEVVQETKKVEEIGKESKNTQKKIRSRISIKTTKKVIRS